ncbi:hypothetical protein EJ065_0506 [Corallococcus coralloides]|uniref:Uncharacterized protein n=1 Tax=Corallococcus coralloides TaxID=184914 RepID=A0A410RJR5_CORCK|nr:hypothetical protein [Corallococcus coralloides]QAT82113.1 hypothetical protein EJ065_0506 [Corallococcus coralloides]
MSFSERTFRFWDFRASHDQLLLRSPRTAQHPQNLDVIFVGVDYLELPTKLGEIEITSPMVEDLRRVQAAFREDVTERDVHVIVSGGRRFVIVAAGMKIIKNDLDLFESSLESF